MEFDELGNWCKWLEKNFSPEIMIPTLPVIIRLDGNNFHNWTKGLERPFDEGLNTLMVETTKKLVKETNAIVGYSQSDEITLILYSPNRKSSIYHDGKKQKILSKLSAKCVNEFNELRRKYLPNHNKTAIFDCRIYQTPTLHDACLQLLWRENDATRNSKQMLGHANFSHNELNLLFNPSLPIKG
jgi:tRNA(His) 5'-end guanylyltransferase